jgi:hypothetical protein
MTYDNKTTPRYTICLLVNGLVDMLGRGELRNRTSFDVVPHLDDAILLADVAHQSAGLLDGPAVLDVRSGSVAANGSAPLVGEDDVNKHRTRLLIQRLEIGKQKFGQITCQLTFRDVRLLFEAGQVVIRKVDVNDHVFGRLERIVNAFETLITDDSVVVEIKVVAF